MDLNSEPATAAPDIARTFSAHHMMTILFDCPLWPTNATDFAPLMLHMTRYQGQSDLILPLMLCRRSLAQQFPSLVAKRDGDLQFTTLQYNLARIAHARRDQLHQWLKKMNEVAQNCRPANPPIFTELTLERQYELADLFDRFVTEKPDRPKAARDWFRSLCLSLFDAELRLNKSVLDPMLNNLGTTFLQCEQQALDTQIQWLEARRKSAKVAPQVQIKPLPLGTYTAEHVTAEMDWQLYYKDATRALYRTRNCWGRLDFFRQEQGRRPTFN